MYFDNNIVSINCPSIDSPISFLSGKLFTVSKSLVWLDSYYPIDMGDHNHGELKQHISLVFPDKYLWPILVCHIHWSSTYSLILNVGLDIQQGFLITPWQLICLSAINMHFIYCMALFLHMHDHPFIITLLLSQYFYSLQKIPSMLFIAIG